MPRAAPKPCVHPGCRMMAVTEGRCAAHRREVVREFESTPWRRYIKSLYNSAEWIALRDQFRREHPLCVDCQSRGLVVIGDHVDHVIPHKGKREVFLDAGNLQMLCRGCHSKKTRRDEKVLAGSGGVSSVGRASCSGVSARVGAVKSLGIFRPRTRAS